MARYVTRDTAEPDLNGECKSLLRLFLLGVTGPSVDRGVWGNWLDAWLAIQYYSLIGEAVIFKLLGQF